MTFNYGLLQNAIAKARALHLWQLNQLVTFDPLRLTPKNMEFINKVLSI